MKDFQFFIEYLTTNTLKKILRDLDSNDEFNAEHDLHKFQDKIETEIAKRKVYENSDCHP